MEYRKKPVVVQAYQTDKREDIFKETYEPLERIPEDKTVLGDSSRSDSLRLAETPVERILKETRPTGEQLMGWEDQKERMKEAKKETPANVEETKSQSGEREEWEKRIEFFDNDEYGIEVIIDGKRDGTLMGYKAMILDFIKELLSESKKEGKQSVVEEMEEVVKKHNEYIGEDYASYRGNPVVLLEDMYRVVLENK